MDKAQTGETHSPRRVSVVRRTGRWLVRGFVAIIAVAVLFVAVAWTWQNLFGPRVDPTLTAPVVIETGVANGGKANGTEAVTEPELPGLLAGLNQQLIDQAAHPLDPVLDLAHRAREKIGREVRDYTAIMSNSVRPDNDGPLRDEQFLFCKIRHERNEDGKTIPFSVYTSFLKPQDKLGQEAIWVEGENENKLVGHNAIVRIPVWLPPDGSIAMEGNRYPIWDIGILKLLDQMIEKGERDRQHGDCQVRLDTEARINDRPCVMIEVLHPKKKKPFDFHLCRIYIDIEDQLPVAYEGYYWPTIRGEEPPLLERYIYTDIKPNVDLDDLDFDSANAEYQFWVLNKKRRENKQD